MSSLCSKHTKGHSPPAASRAGPQAPSPKHASQSDSKEQPLPLRLDKANQCQAVVLEFGEQGTHVLKVWELRDSISPCKILGSKGVFAKCLGRNDRAFQVSCSCSEREMDVV